VHLTAPVFKRGPSPVPEASIRASPALSALAGGREGRSPQATPPSPSATPDPCEAALRWEAALHWEASPLCRAGSAASVEATDVRRGDAFSSARSRQFRSEEVDRRCTIILGTWYEAAKSDTNRSHRVLPRSKAIWIASDEDSLQMERKRGRLRCLSGVSPLISESVFAPLRMTHGGTNFCRVEGPVPQRLHVKQRLSSTGSKTFSIIGFHTSKIDPASASRQTSVCAGVR
jgi:hypothetical protein